MRHVVIITLTVIGLIAVAYFSVSTNEVETKAAVDESSDHVITMGFNEDEGTVFFSPKVLRISSGDTVTWVQQDEFNDHDVVSYPDGIPASAELFEGPLLSEIGQSYSVTFTVPGTYRYHCHPHEQLGMRGTIIVDRESRSNEFRVARPEEIHKHSGGKEMQDSDMDMSDQEMEMPASETEVNHDHAEGDDHG